jgi:hypothetical protein
MRLFLSYRRDDSPFVAGRLKDRMVEAFGEDNIFYDVDSIEPGFDFRDAIAERLRDADAVLAVIGPGWDPERLRDENDFVRIELEQTLRSGTRLIPTLIAPAVMPTPGDLPESLKSLAFRNGVHVRPDPDFDTDVERLLKGLSGSEEGAARWIRLRRAQVALLGSALAAAVVVLFIVITALSGGGDPNDGGESAQTTVGAMTAAPFSSASPPSAATTAAAISSTPTTAAATTAAAIDSTPTTTAATTAPLVNSTPTAPPPTTDVWAGDTLRSGIDLQTWNVRADTGTTVQSSPDGAIIDMGPSAARNAQAWIRTTCRFPADFAVSVAYNIGPWDTSRGQRLGLLAIVDDRSMLALQRNSDEDEDHYLIDFGQDGRFTEAPGRPVTTGTGGELRLTRVADIYTAQYRDGSDREWADVGLGGRSFTGPISIGVSLWSSVGGKTLEVIFHDFVIESGRCDA